ncbi:MAG: hypothetical protein WD359_08080 [Dehalococcoidia bacterium]
MASPQVLEMINELQEHELQRVSVHRIDAIQHHRGGIRSVAASTLVRLGMTLDRHAGARTASARIASPTPRREFADTCVRDADTALHW